MKILHFFAAALLALSGTNLRANASQQPPAGSLNNVLTVAYKEISTGKNKTAAPTRLSAKTNGLMKNAIDQKTLPLVKELTARNAEQDNLAKLTLKTAPEKKTAFDLLSDLEKVPQPSAGLAANDNDAMTTIFQPFYNLLNQRKEQLRSLTGKNNLYQQVYEKEGNKGLEKRAAAEADKNAMVKNLGGAEKLMNMTEAERAVAAEEMKKQILQNPGSIAPASSDPGINSLQQKLMTDPAYAKRFSNMSEDEKHTEMRKYMSTKPTEKKPSATYTSNASTGKQAEVMAAMELDLAAAATFKKLQESGTLYSNMISASGNVIEELKKELTNWVETTTKTIPVIELGEAGHDHDPELMQAMEITRRQAYYHIEQKEVELRVICWKYFKNTLLIGLKEFNDYAADYKWGNGNDSQLFDGTYTDPKMANALAGFYEQILESAKMAEKITSDAIKSKKNLEGSF